MEDWMKKWVAGPQECAQYEPWGNCFMRLTNNGANGIDCLTTYSGEEGCYAPKIGEIVKGPAEIWYGAWILHEYLGKLFLWDTAHQPKGYSANVARIVNFLSSERPPWVNDTGLHRLDKRVAKMMNDTWNAGTLNGDSKDSEGYNLDYVLWRALKKFESGDFLKLAANGTLLHSPL
ncbi:MAG: hypothetical protein Q9182_005032 [Xanthomendoza sp. 2 TL-2023]